MKVVSLFAGIGGFDLAFRSLGHEIVYANEWDKYASQVYEKHFLHAPDTRDITTVDASEIPNHDLLIAGFPCQAFSIAGKRRGFADTRGTLFFDVARILSKKRPTYLLLENVKGLLNHDHGRTFATILRVLADLGYGVEWQVLNSKHFGVPQNRERIFIIGHLRGASNRQILPIEGSISNFEQGNTEGEKWLSDTITGRYANRNGRGTHIRTDEQDTRPKGNKPDSSNSIRRTSYTDGARVRRLTPTECERLQGFPDGWTEGLSDTQRYKTLGNAVTVNVVKAIAHAFDDLV